MNANRQALLILTLAGIVVAAIVSVTYAADLSKNSSASLPAGCVKPAGGFLVIASVVGYNDSIGHGAPTKSWPIITVKKGASVTIVVCNIDRQAHGFQITHYFDSSIETVEPGHVITVQFVAAQAGTFEIYCSIFCTIHIYMQNGQLIVNQ
jgi:heme/copper-type cytochrome/quinol oxidase subunit 2